MHSRSRVRGRERARVVSEAVGQRPWTDTWTHLTSQTVVLSRWRAGPAGTQSEIPIGLLCYNRERRLSPRVAAIGMPRLEEEVAEASGDRPAGDDLVWMCMRGNYRSGSMALVVRGTRREGRLQHGPRRLPGAGRGCRGVGHETTQSARRWREEQTSGSRIGSWAAVE